MRILRLSIALSLFSLFVGAGFCQAETYGDPLHYQISKRKDEQAAQASILTPASISKININTASAVMLDKSLKGIGAAKAKAIVDYRSEHGPFQTIDELIEVKGIGPAILEKNAGLLTID
jgi:competence protein ComEA